MTDEASQPFDALAKQISAGVVAGMSELLRDEEFIEQMGTVMIRVIQRQAAERTGNFLLSAARSILVKGLVIGAIWIALSQLVGPGSALRAMLPAFSKGTQ